MKARPADNPFTSRRIDSLRYRHRDLVGRDLLGCLARNNQRGAVVGPHGSGKTTLIEQLAADLDGEIVWVRLSSDTTRALQRDLAALPSPVGGDHVVLVDGAEQLGPIEWRRLYRSVSAAGTVVITCHTPGRLPTIHECRTDPELLRDLVAELAPDAVDAIDLEALFHRHSGNIRLCFRELYDLYAGRRTP